MCGTKQVFEVVKDSGPNELKESSKVTILDINRAVSKLNNLNCKQKEQLIDLLTQYIDIFNENQV